MYENHDHLFTLHVRPYRREHDPRVIVVRAFDANHTDSTGHSRIDVEVRHGGEVIFPRGALYCGVSRGTTVDGIEARELVLSLVAMRPGDTDREYFAGYTPDQLDWVDEHGEAIGMERERRYCDADGNVRRRVA